MGELHLEIVVDRLRRGFQVECNQGAPGEVQRAITGNVEHRRCTKNRPVAGRIADIPRPHRAPDRWEDGPGVRRRDPRAV